MTAKPMPVATLRRLVKAADTTAAVNAQRLQEAEARGAMFGLALVRLMESRRPS